MAGKGETVKNSRARKEVAILELSSRWLISNMVGGSGAQLRRRTEAGIFFQDQEAGLIV